MDAPNFKHLLANGQLLIYVADAVSPSIRYMLSILINVTKKTTGSTKSFGSEMKRMMGPG